MECEAGHLSCQLLSWISENELVADLIGKYAGNLGARVSEFWRTYPDFFRDMIALAVFAFGVWRWWRYRDQILHERLKEYLEESDKRLKDGQRYVLDALQRPGPGQPPQLPLFAPSKLRSVLRERNWDRPVVAATVERSADLELIDAGERIGRQLKTADNSIASLRHLSVTTNILRGAIAASLAGRAPARWIEQNNVALNHFRAALATPGHEQNVVAKEFEAHQLRKLGMFLQALDKYRELERFAENLPVKKDRDFTVARAKRYQAEVMQAEASFVLHDGTRTFGNLKGACGLLHRDDPTIETAQTLRNAHFPLRGWDLIEQGDLHYVTAFISRNCNYPVKEGEQLDDAQTAYRTVLAETPRSFLKRRAVARIRADAEAGLNRVQDARSGNYDWRWMMPGLQNMQ